jgi:hypothetical protein
MSQHLYTDNFNDASLSLDTDDDAVEATIGIRNGNTTNYYLLTGDEIRALVEDLRTAYNTAEDRRIEASFFPAETRPLPEAEVAWINARYAEAKIMLAAERRPCGDCDCPAWEYGDDLFCRNCDHEESDHGEITLKYTLIITRPDGGVERYGFNSTEEASAAGRGALDLLSTEEMKATTWEVVLT